MAMVAERPGRPRSEQQTHLHVGLSRKGMALSYSHESPGSHGQYQRGNQRQSRVNGEIFAITAALPLISPNTSASPHDCAKSITSHACGTGSRVLEQETQMRPGSASSARIPMRMASGAASTRSPFCAADGAGNRKKGTAVRRASVRRWEERTVIERG